MTSSKAAVPAPGAETSGDSYLPGHGNGGYHVRHYDLDLDYRVAPNRLSGTAVLTCVATQALSRFTLDLGEFRVSRVLVDGKPAKFARRALKLQVKPAKSVPAGTEFQVEVRYVGNPRPVPSRWGDIGWDELTDGALVASQPIGAPSWFPCNDHPADKASYRVAVSTSSTYLVAVTGNLVSRTQSASTAQWVFERPEPTATYLMSVQIGRYDDVELVAGAGAGWLSHPEARSFRLRLGFGRGNGVESVATTVPQRAAVPPRLRKAFARDFGRQGRMMDALQRWYGPYPFGEYVVVVTDDELDDPIEAQGMAIFGANHVDGKRTYERLVVHELAHQWFGNSLTVADWRHIWLNEGFATYTEWLWSEEAGGEPAAAFARWWHARIKTKPADVRISDPGVGRMFDERVYKRGALTLHALRGEIGDAAFFALVKAWAAERRHATVSTEQFVTAAEAFAGRSLREFFTGWLETPALPPL
ncbi:M1 family metallopeptidase [Amycolatopsis sp. FDAARGOS 1241]|uniref:M1 family metallopeptidase n=1 Tax=Amycolatopsis sp. FDAARGOS 1241 TaxID=2778070 RepID=UPI001951D2BC|nr:M1 family metallopeptidase [Amycolatopsis sp. FDAARGOS 1241]QRP49000.1 M1 family metallopeptidase [Amycolatopsis sp. FDAARGOS 1241]